MQSSFLFAVDACRSLIRVEMGGFFDAPDVACFRAGLEQALATLDAAPNQHVMIVDIRDMKVQAQGRVADFQAIFAEPGYRSSRLAIVAGSSLSRTQVKRAAAGREAAYFDRPDDAEAWLFGASHLLPAGVASGGYRASSDQIGSGRTVPSRPVRD